MKTSKESNPLATIGAIITLTVIARSAKHCMKKYALKPSRRRKIR